MEFNSDLKFLEERRDRMGKKDLSQGKRSKGSKAKEIAKTAFLIPAIPIAAVAYMVIGEILGYIILGLILVILAIIIVFLILIFTPFFYLFDKIGLPEDVSCCLSLLIVGALIFTPLFFIARRAYRKKKEKDEYQMIMRILKKRKDKEKEPVDFQEWYGSWDYFDNEEHVKKMSYMRGASSSSYQDQPEDPEYYYKKRWESDNKER